MNNTCEELIKEIQKMQGYFVIGDKVVESPDGPFLLRADVMQKVAEYHPPVRLG